MRILFTGATPWTNSGYGKPSRYLFPRLHALGHELALAAFYGWQGATKIIRVGDAPVRIFSMARERFFNDIIEYHAASFEADVVISFQDVWVLEHWGDRGFRWCPHFPIDTQPVSQAILRALEDCHTPLALTKWGQQELIEHGWPNARHIPLGVDLEVYQPRDQVQARERAGLLQDTYIVGMIAANSSYPSRKSFPEVLQAWQQWRAEGGEGLLYLHTTLTPKRQEGIDFLQLLSTMGLDWTTMDDPDEERKARASVMFACQHRMWCHAYDDQALADLYNSFDILFSPSMAEGFGIPILEAQASGVPVVTLAVTSMPEITFSGICIEPEQMAWDSQGGWRGIAPMGKLMEALQWGDSIRGGEKAREHYAKKARVHAEDFGFDKLVADYWSPFLKELEDELA